MANETNRLERHLQPLIVLSLFGLHEVHYTARSGKVVVPKIATFTDMAQAQAFAENQCCHQVLLKVQAYISNLDFIRFTYPVAFHNIQSHIKNITCNVKRLQVLNNLTKVGLAYQLQETIIPQLNLCRGSRETKTSQSCTRLINDLLPFVAKYIVHDGLMDFSVIDQL